MHVLVAVCIGELHRLVEIFALFDELQAHQVAGGFDLGGSDFFFCFFGELGLVGFDPDGELVVGDLDLCHPLYSN